MPSQPITEYQFEKLLELTRRERNKFIVERDCLYYELCYYLGFRPSEARLIKISYINFAEKSIFIPAENNKERHADNFPIPDFILDKIRKYILKMPFKTAWLFPCYWNVLRKKDIPIHIWCLQRDFTRRIRALGFLYVSFVDKHGFSRYNLNLYSFRKRFGTFIYKKTHCPQTTALMLRQYDRQLKSVWSYVFNVQKEERGELMKKIYG